MLLTPALPPLLRVLKLNCAFDFIKLVFLVTPAAASSAFTDIDNIMNYIILCRNKAQIIETHCHFLPVSAKG